MKNNILYINERIYISSKKFRNTLFKLNHDNVYKKHFKYKKVLELVRRKY